MLRVKEINMKSAFNTLSIATMLFLNVGCSETNTEIEESSTLTNDQIVEIAKEAYVFGYPLILMDYTKLAYTNIEKPNDGRAQLIK